MIKDTVEIQNKVYLASAINPEFSDSYLKVRELEKRIYADDIVSQLPYLTNKHEQFKEWKLRQKSTGRFVDYLKQTNNKRLLEIGCGNGWFVAGCSKYVKEAVGIDVNLPELKQGARLFKQTNLNFMYWDVFTKTPFTKKFDIIVLNACVQYFPDFERLKNRLLELLTPGGEIHIVDSPFYKKEEIEGAKKRTLTYYKGIGVEEMIHNYHHHLFEKINDFEALYKPTTSILNKLIKKKDMPFGWYRLKV